MNEKRGLGEIVLGLGGWKDGQKKYVSWMEASNYSLRDIRSSNLSPIIAQRPRLIQHLAGEKKPCSGRSFIRLMFFSVSNGKISGPTP